MRFKRPWPQLGKPLVGPAGKKLTQILEAAGVGRKKNYVTNAVKHFKWTPGGRPQKPRLHKTPSAKETKICSGLWLEKEIYPWYD